MIGLKRTAMAGSPVGRYNAGLHAKQQKQKREH